MFLPGQKVPLCHVRRSLQDHGNHAMIICISGVPVCPMASFHFAIMDVYPWMFHGALFHPSVPDTKPEKRNTNTTSATVSARRSIAVATKTALEGARGDSPARRAFRRSRLGRTFARRICWRLFNAPPFAGFGVLRCAERRRALCLVPRAFVLPWNHQTRVV